MKGKLLKSITTVLLAATVLTGCASGASSGSSTDKASGGEAATIKMTFITAGTEPEDLGKIEDRLSEMTMERIGCKVELVPVSFADQTTKYNMWFANGTDMDIMITAFQDYVSMINAGAFREMDDLLAIYGKDIVSKDTEKNFLGAGVYKGKQYGIPTIPAAPGNGGAIYIRKDVYDSLDNSAWITKDYMGYEELDNMFGQIQQKYPQYMPYGVSGDVTTYGTNYYFMKNYDNLGRSGGYSGVLMDPMNSTEIVNLFASDEYYEYLTWMRKWYQNGYISKDAATATESADALFKAGRTATMIGTSTPSVRESYEEQCGIEIVQLDLCPNYMTTNVYTGCMFFISKNSKNPEKAMELLNLLFINADVQNLLSYGIEGDHYTVQDNGMVIDFTANREKYINPIGVWGDQSQFYLTAPQTPEILEDRKAYLQVSMDHISKAFGYQFDGTEVSTELSTVKSVSSKYLTQLEYGTVDLDTVYPEFLDALRDAGIEKIIEANRSQLAAWEAAQK